MLSEKEIQITPAEYTAWLNHPTTQAVFEALAAERSVWVQRLAFGETLMRPSLEIRDTAEAVGTIAGLTIILEDMQLTLQDQWQEAAERKQEMEEEEDDGK